MTHQFLIFDGDDTLWDTQSIYTKAIDNFYDTLYSFGFGPRSDLIKHFTEMNVEYVTASGFGERHLGMIMDQFYQELCATNAKPINEFARSAVRSIGDSVYDAVPETIPMARGVLRMLGRENIIILYTAGNEVVQRQKLYDTDMESLFDEVWITSRKDADDLYRRLELAKIPHEDVILIGNSLNSDIMPAVSVGIHAIHFDNATWAYENVVPEEPEGVIRVKSLLDVADAVDYIRALNGIKVLNSPLFSQGY